MAVFISKHAHYRAELRGELRGPDTLLPGGVSQKNIVKQPLTAEFTLTEGITRYEQEYAFRHFAGVAQPRRDGSGGFVGADPSTSANPIYMMGEDGRAQVVDTTLPYDVRHHFSKFDTAWINDPDDRVFAEEMLRNGPTNGVAYVEIVAEMLPAPWPTYDLIAQGATMEIPSLTRKLGLDPVLVARYEAATKNRPGVIAGLAKLSEVITEEHADEDALERVIQ